MCLSYASVVPAVPSHVLAVLRSCETEETCDVESMGLLLVTQDSFLVPTQCISVSEEAPCKS
jgi:hypothetical protein